jgi:hypothetical protein
VRYSEMLPTMTLEILQVPGCPGADPFARPGLIPAVSCRLYRDEHGRQVPAPSGAQLRAVLGL